MSLTKWMHDHPTALKVIQVVGGILGVASIASIPLILPILSIAVISGIATVGGLCLLSVTASWIFLKYITCAAHDLNHHEFKESQCEGGRLYYQGNIPILELDGIDPYQAGYAHGLLLGSHIHELTNHLNLIMHTVLRKPRASELTEVLAELRQQIPSQYLDEMRGLSEGYNQWAEEANVSTSMTLDDILLIHLIPDSKHFHPGQTHIERENILTEAPACTSILHRDEDNNLIFSRNMDWCPFGQGGAKSLVIVWKEQNIAALGVPGMIGAGTGWNKDRLSIAMNVCPGETSEISGMPAILFNRYVLENAQTVGAALQLIGPENPLGPYHLTLADAEGDGACVSFYQGDQETNYIRHLDNNLPLSVLNWRYPECKGGTFNSEGRAELLDRYFEGTSSIAPEPIEWRKIMENALRLTPLVNSWITMHSLVFLPRSDEVSISCDNGYAASGPHETIAMTEVF